MLYTICIALILVASVLVILAVLVQNPKSGMAANFGASNQVMGVRETTNFLEKFTWSMAIAIVVLSLAATLAMDRGLVADSNSEISKDAKALQERVIEYDAAGRDSLCRTDRAAGRVKSAFRPERRGGGRDSRYYRRPRIFSAVFFCRPETAPHGRFIGRDRNSPAMANLRRGSLAMKILRLFAFRSGNRTDESRLRFTYGKGPRRNSRSCFVRSGMTATARPPEPVRGAAG